MSYILDALKKADEARHRTRNPILDRVRAPGGAPRRRWPWIAAAAVALAVNGAVLVYMLRPTVVVRARDSVAPQPPSTTQGESTLSRTPAPGGIGPARSPSPPARVEAVKPPVQAPTARVDAVTPGQTPPSPRPEERRAEAAAPARVPAAPVTPPPAVPRTATAPTGAPAQRGTSAELSSPAQPTPSAPASAGGDVLSKLRLTVHVYADSPGDRLVFIDGRKYVPGDRIDGKVLLEEITQDGAVVSFEGRRTLLRP